MRTIHKLIAVSAAALIASVVNADVVVVVSSKSPVGNLTSEQVSQLFLGKASTFPGGMQAMPIDQAEGQSPRDEFYTKITGKSAAQVKAYWSKIIFTGKGQPPKEVPNTAEVKKLVSGNPNTIGYIEKSAVDSSVKVVLSE